MENGNKQNNKWKKPLFLDKRKETKQIKNEFVGDKNKTTNGNKTTQQVFFCLKSWTFFFIFYFYFLFETFLSLLLFQPWWPLATFFLYYFSLCIPFLSAFLSLCVYFLSVFIFFLYYFSLFIYLLYVSTFINLPPFTSPAYAFNLSVYSLLLLLFRVWILFISRINFKFF